MQKFVVASVGAVALTGMVAMVLCTRAKGEADKAVAVQDEGEVLTPSVVGQWMIENVVENDSCYVRPAEVGTGVTAYVDFRDDGSFGIVTNCNHLAGQYSQANDSVHLTDISTTELACDNMEVEELLKKVLPDVNEVDFINDSIARLNTSRGESYIVLKKRSKSLK